MTIEPADDLFAQHILRSRIITAEQLDAAREEQSHLSVNGQTLSLASVLVRQGMLTDAILENVEKTMQSPPKPGAQNVGQYKLLKKLGEGAMGAVYLAEDTVAQRQVAIKLLPKKFAAKPEFLARFKREAKSAGRLNHPNVVAAYTTGEEKGLHFYVMEYCEGESLDKILKREKRLEWDRAVDYTLQIARGLNHAHNLDIIHRDIKPSNIFITEQGVAKILDMGLSKNIADSEQSFNTDTGLALGTPHYISPEQAKGEKDIDGRTDIYSLGSTLYHLLTGETPYQGGTPAVVMMKHLNERLPNPQETCPDVPDGIVKIIQKMMTKEASDRYRSCAELIADLELVAGGRNPVNADVEEDKTSVRMRAVPRTGVDAGKGVKKPVVSRIPPRARTQPIAARPSAPKKSLLPLYVGGAAAVAVLVIIAAFAMGGGKKHSRERAGAGVTAVAETIKKDTPRSPASTQTDPKQKDTATKEDTAKTGAVSAGIAGDLAAKDAEKARAASAAPVDAASTWHVGDWTESVRTLTVNGQVHTHTFRKTLLRKTGKELVFEIVSNEGGKESRDELRVDTAHAASTLNTMPLASRSVNELQTGTDTLVVAGKRLNTTWTLTQVEMEVKGDKHFATVKEWISKEVPLGGNVRMEMTGTQSMTTELKDFGFAADKAATDSLPVETAPAPAEAAPMQNACIPFDLSAAFNADVISTEGHEAADSFKADMVSSWTTAGWLRVNKKKDKKEMGLPDDGIIKIPKTTPQGYFTLGFPPAKNAILFTHPKGRYPNPVTVRLPENQRRKYAQLAFLHGGSSGDGRLRVALKYATGKPEQVFLKIEDWHPDFRTTMAQRESVAAGTLTTHDKPAEMCAQSIVTDPSRVLESLTFSFEPIDGTELRQDDRFTAGIFAVSGLPAEK